MRKERRTKREREEKNVRAKFICIGPPSLFRAEIQLIGFPGITTRVRVRGRPFFSGPKRERERERGPAPREKYIELIQFRPYAAVPPSRPSLFLSFRFYVRLAPFSFRALPQNHPRPPSTRLEFIFPYESFRAKLPRHAGFKYGQAVV